MVGVLYAGLPRVGKSSAVAVQTVSNLKKDIAYDGSSSYLHRHSAGDPKISHSPVAKSIHVTMYRDWRGRTIILDAPGLIDNRNKAYKLWSNFSLETSYALAENIKATSVVIHYTSSFAPGANADTFRDLAVALLAGSGPEDTKAFCDNLCLLFTHVPSYSKLDGIVRRLEDVYVSFLKEHCNILEDLTRRYPATNHTGARLLSAAQKHIGNAMAAVSGVAHYEVEDLRGKIERRRGRINFEHERLQDDPQLITLERVNASIVLLETILHAAKTKRVVLSKPDDEKGCQKQRLEMEAAYRACRPLCRSVLRRMAASRRLPSYEVYEILEHLARQMNTKLETFNRAMSTFLESASKKDQVIRAISDDWRAY